MIRLPTASTTHAHPPSAGRRLVLQGGASLALLQALGATTLTHLAAATDAEADTLPPAPSRWQNWSGLQQATPARWLTPADEDALREALARTQGELRPVGSGHSFTALVPTSATLVSLDRLAGVVDIDPVARTVTAWAGTRIQALARALDAQGLALRNQPDVDVQTLAGAIATGTHGTGATLPALHDDVVAMRIVTPDGRVRMLRAEHEPDELAAARVSLGALGLVTQVTLRVVPAFNLHRTVWLEPLEAMLAQAPALAARHRHFEFYVLPFTGYAAGIRHDVYTGQDLALPQPADEDVLGDLKALRDWLGRFPALRQWVAQRAIDPAMREEARHRSFRLLSSVRATRFNETEWHVPRAQGIACLREVVRRIEQRNEAFFPIEFRYVRGDGAWLSPFHGRDSCSIAIHAAADEPWQYLLSDFLPLMQRHQGRPHWGKLHSLRARELAALYPRWADFQAVRQRFDPQQRMLNAHLRQLFGVAAA